MLHGLSKIYHGTVTPTYVWLGNKLGGRANAGRVARYGRIGRVFANAISLSVIGAAIAQIGWSTFWTSGAALPMWGVIGLGIGIGINFVSWLCSAAANHLKIEQYYDAEMELHAENDELFRYPSKLTAIVPKRAANAARTLHDINSYAGTAIGIATGVPMILTLLSLATYSFAPPIAVTLFIVSRASALASVICVWGTNQFRLWAYKKALDQEMSRYYFLKNNESNTILPPIIKIVDNAILGLDVSSDQKYTSWVRFRCIKALESAWGEITLSDTQKNELVEFLKDNLRPFTGDNGEFSREKLMHINGPHGPTLSVLDSMLILEAKLFDALSRWLNVDRHPVIQSIVEQSRISDTLVRYHLGRELLLQKRLPEASSRLLNAKVPEPTPVITAHGSVLLPYYGARKMAEEMVREPVEYHGIRI